MRAHAVLCILRPYYAFSTPKAMIAFWHAFSTPKAVIVFDIRFPKPTGEIIRHFTHNTVSKPTVEIIRFSTHNHCINIGICLLRIHSQY
jgi:hypothetical protein